MLNYFVDWDFISRAIQNETYLVSIWFFKSLPHIFNKAYTISIVDAKKHVQQIKSVDDVNKMLDAFEEKENIELDDEKRGEILDVAQDVIEKNGKEMFHQFEI